MPVFSRERAHFTFSEAEKYCQHLCAEYMLIIQQISTPPSSFFIAFGWSIDSPCSSHTNCSRLRSLTSCSLRGQLNRPVSRRSSPSAEQEQAVGEQVKFELLLYDSRKTVNGFSHIRMPAHDVDAGSSQFLQHCFSPLSRARIVSLDMFCGSSISMLFFRIIILSLLDIAAFGMTVSASSAIAADTLTGTMLCFQSHR